MLLLTVSHCIVDTHPLRCHITFHLAKSVSKVLQDACRDVDTIGFLDQACRHASSQIITNKDGLENAPKITLRYDWLCGTGALMASWSISYTYVSVDEITRLLHMPTTKEEMRRGQTQVQGLQAPRPDLRIQKTDVVEQQRSTEKAEGGYQEYH